MARRNRISSFARRVSISLECHGGGGWYGDGSKSGLAPWLRTRDLARGSSGVGPCSHFATNARLRQRAYGRAARSYLLGARRVSARRTRCDRPNLARLSDGRDDRDGHPASRPPSHAASEPWLTPSLRGVLRLPFPFDQCCPLRGGPWRRRAQLPHGRQGHRHSVARTVLTRATTRGAPTASWRRRVLSAFGFRSRRRRTVAPLVAAGQPPCARTPPPRAP